MALVGKPSIPAVVASIITHNPPVYECIKAKLINYHALAANIKSEVERKAGKPTSVNTIVVAIMRFSDSIEDEGGDREGLLSVLRAARITLASDVVDVTVKTKRSELLPMVKQIAELSAALDEPVHLFQLSNSIKLIADEAEYKSLMRGSLGKGRIAKETSRLSRLDVHLSPEAEINPEFGLFLTELLYRHGIRIHQTYISEETILILDRDDGPRAYEILRGEIDGAIREGEEGETLNGKSDVDEYISKVDPKLRPQFKKLRSIIKDALPGAVESVKRGVPYYTLDGVGVASLADYSEHVNLYIMQGAKLSSDLLEGTGKGMRHITVRTVAEINGNELARLLREAGALGTKEPRGKKRDGGKAR